MKRENIMKELKNSQKPVIICGAGIVGNVLLSMCRDEGINIECFCDSSEKASQSDFCDLEVVHTPDLKSRYNDATIIISVAAIKDVVDLLEESGFSDWHAGGLLLKNLDISQNQPDASLDYTKFAIDNCILCHDGYLSLDKLFFRSIDLIITERCSLKCKDCSNLMQYYENPRNVDIGILMKSIDVFCSVVDEVMDFRVIGGETFMNKEWPLVVKRLTNEPKAKRVVLYTNATIIPDEKHIPILQHDKVIVIVTDYGHLSKKLVELKQILKENKITHHILKMDDWLDCSAIMPHRRSTEENRNIFKTCCAKNMPTLSNGKLFRCPYAANALRLGAVPDNSGDYIDLFDENLYAAGKFEVKNKIKNYILHKDYMEICDFCNGRPLSGKEVKPAVQTDNPLTYRKYVTKEEELHI